MELCSRFFFFVLSAKEGQTGTFHTSCKRKSSICSDSCTVVNFLSVVVVDCDKYLFTGHVFVFNTAIYYKLVTLCASHKYHARNEDKNECECLFHFVWYFKFTLYRCCGGGIAQTVLNLEEFGLRSKVKGPMTNDHFSSLVTVHSSLNIF